MHPFLSNEDFQYVYERTPRLCVDILVKSDTGILLSKRNILPESGVWHIPGGTVRKNELLVDSVKRIALQETGLMVEIEKQLGVLEYIHEDQGNWERHSVSVVFLVSSIGGELKRDFQSSELAYVTHIPPYMYSGQSDFLRAHNVLG